MFLQILNRLIDTRLINTVTLDVTFTNPANKSCQIEYLLDQKGNDLWLAKRQKTPPHIHSFLHSYQSNPIRITFIYYHLSSSIGSYYKIASSLKKKTGVPLLNTNLNALWFLSMTDFDSDCVSAALILW